nr:MAG TPA: hypothetical protein [Caudoviricetes sp.]
MIMTEQQDIQHALQYGSVPSVERRWQVMQNETWRMEKEKNIFKRMEQGFCKRFPKTYEGNSQ